MENLKQHSVKEVLVSSIELSQGPLGCAVGVSLQQHCRKVDLYYNSLTLAWC